MRIAFVCPVFPPEPAPAGVMANELAAALAEDGHDVTVFTQFPNRPSGKVFPGYRRGLRTIESIAGFRVVRCPNWLLDKHRRPWNRILENLTFGFSSCVNLLLRGRPDIVLLESWPLAATEMVLCLCTIWRIPVINYVKDLYPEALEHTGLIKLNGRLAQLLRSWDRSICDRSARVVVISDGMKSLICESRQVTNSRIVVISDWVDEHRFSTFSRVNSWRRENGISDHRFVLLYAGTLGHVSGAGVIVEVARELAANQDVLVVCVGEGVLKREMQERAALYKLQNLLFLSVQPADRVAEMHSAADATLLTTQANYPDASVPSKLISYLAAARPVVCAAHRDSTVARIVERAVAGVLALPEDPQSIAEVVSSLLASPQQVKSMGENARGYFEEAFTFKQAYQKFTKLFFDVAGSRPVSDSSSVQGLIEE